MFPNVRTKFWANPYAGSEKLRTTRIVARPFGYADTEALWPEVFDGFLFTNTMTPSEQVELMKIDD